MCVCVWQVSVNIALEALLLRPDALVGLLCTVLQRPPLLPPLADASQHNTLLDFRCHTLNVSGSPPGQLSQVRGLEHTFSAFSFHSKNPSFINLTYSIYHFCIIDTIFLFNAVKLYCQSEAGGVYNRGGGTFLFKRAFDWTKVSI